MKVEIDFEHMPPLTTQLFVSFTHGSETTDWLLLMIATIFRSKVIKLLESMSTHFLHKHLWHVFKASHHTKTILAHKKQIEEPDRKKKFSLILGFKKIGAEFRELLRANKLFETEQQCRTVFTKYLQCHTEFMKHWGSTSISSKMLPLSVILLRANSQYCYFPTQISDPFFSGHSTNEKFLIKVSSLKKLFLQSAFQKLRKKLSAWMHASVTTLFFGVHFQKIKVTLPFCHAIFQKLQKKKNFQWTFVDSCLHGVNAFWCSLPKNQRYFFFQLCFFSNTTKRNFSDPVWTCLHEVSTFWCTQEPWW